MSKTEALRRRGRRLDIEAGTLFGFRASLV